MEWIQFGVAETVESGTDLPTAVAVSQQMPGSGFEPPREKPPTRPSTLRVCQFRHPGEQPKVKGGYSSRDCSCISLPASLAGMFMAPSASAATDLRARSSCRNAISTN